MKLSLLQHLLVKDSARRRIIYRTMKDGIREKYKTLNKNLEEEYVLIHVNTADDLLNVPEYVKVKSSVTLKISRWFRGMMELYEDRVDADLLFNGSYFSCSVPLRAVWGITASDGQHTVWPDSAPPDVLISLLNPQLYARAQQRSQAGGKGEKAKEADEARDLPAKGHLRRVK